MTSFSALVTGGASGLGLAVCRRLARRGAHVVSLDLQQSAENVQNVRQIRGDIRREDDIDAALAECRVADAPRLDVLVNCAGVANAFKIYNLDQRRAQRLQDFQTLLEINVLALFSVVARAVALIGRNERQKDGTRGLVLMTSSTLASEGHEGQAGFAATQAAVDAMTLPMARDLAAQGIRVNTIAPGFFATPLVLRSDSPELLDFIRLTTPCPQRLGHPEEFGHLVDHVIDNPMINGHVIRIDGANRWPERD